MNEENLYQPISDKPFMPIAIELVLLIMTMLFCLLLGQGIGLTWVEIQGLDLSQITDIEVEIATANDRNLLRLLALFSNGFTFLVPALIFSFFMYRKHWLGKLQLNSAFYVFWIPVMLIFTLAGFFFSQFTYWVNQMLPLPAWMLQMEESTGGMVKSMLNMPNTGEFMFTLLVVAIIPALGEELIFRGILQRRLEEVTQKPYVAIGVSAVIFSFIHFQFAGFLPRMVLGLILGYLFFCTRNLWVPILAHFLINGLQVVASFLLNIDPDKIQNTRMEDIQTSQMLVTAIISLIFIYLAGKWFHQNRIKIKELPNDFNRL